MREERAKGFLERFSIILVAVSVLGVAGFLSILPDLPVEEPVQRALAFVAGLGWMAPVAYAGLYVVGSVLCLPCFPLTIGAGFVFGFGKGFLIASLSSTLGAACAFLTGRYLARNRISGWMASHPGWRALDRTVAREGWKIVLLARLGSAFPFNVVNYGFGLSGARFSHFVLATWLGRLPITAVHTHIGAVSASLVAIDGGGGPASGLERLVTVIGWAASLGVTLYLARLAQEALAERE